MFTGGTIWLWTHGHISNTSQAVGVHTDGPGRKAAGKGYMVSPWLESTQGLIQAHLPLILIPL